MSTARLKKGIAAPSPSDDLTLLKMWTETTAQSIFHERKIGALVDGYEASFLALEGNPLEDWKNTKRIRVRFKQGFIIQP